MQTSKEVIAKEAIAKEANLTNRQIAELIGDLDGIHWDEKLALIESKLTDEFLSKLTIIQDDFLKKTFIKKECNEICYDLLDEVDELEE